MIEINLLPEGQRKKKGMELPAVSFLPVIAACVGVLVVIHLFFSLLINLRTMGLTRFEKRWQEVLPDNKRATEFKFELAAMRTKIDAIDNLIHSRMSWAKKLSDLSDAIILGVWLNKLWLEKKVISQNAGTSEGAKGSGQVDTAPEKIIVKTLHLDGSVIATGGEETAAIGRFIRSLKNNAGFFADFKEIESVSIQRTRLKDVEVMDFELVCYFK